MDALGLLRSPCQPGMMGIVPQTDTWGGAAGLWSCCELILMFTGPSLPLGGLLRCA